MTKYLLLIFTVILVTSATFAQPITGTFAIQNSKTGKNLRPYDAGGQNGNKIVSYNHVEWKCMTWNFKYEGGDTYQLRNLFTSKTFQPVVNPSKDGSALEQQPLSGDSIQRWEFIKATESTYYIRLKGTHLYITASSDKSNSDIILKEKQSGALQIWRLVAQNPTM